MLKITSLMWGKQLWAHSSVGKSDRLIIDRSQVQVLVGPLINEALCIRALDDKRVFHLSFDMFKRQQPMWKRLRVLLQYYRP